MYPYSISTVHTVLQRILQTRAHKDLSLGTKLCLVLKWVLQHCQAWAPVGPAASLVKQSLRVSSRVPPPPFISPSVLQLETNDLQWDGLWSKCFATGKYGPFCLHTLCPHLIHVFLLWSKPRAEECLCTECSVDTGVIVSPLVYALPRMSANDVNQRGSGRGRERERECAGPRSQKEMHASVAPVLWQQQVSLKQSGVCVEEPSENNSAI